MFSPEFARTFHADREREIREHVRVRGLLREVADAAAKRCLEQVSRSPWVAPRRESAPDGIAR